MNKNREKNLRALAKLMNQQNSTSIPVTRALLSCFDSVITPEENEFLLRIGTAPLKFEQARNHYHGSDNEFPAFFLRLLQKGLVWSKQNEEGEEFFELAPILLGWFEVYLSDGDESPSKKEFARRVDELFRSWGKLNSFPIRQLWNLKHKSDTPHKQIYSAAKIKETVTVKLNRQIEAAETQIFPSHHVKELIERYGERNQIAVVHCFCRQWHKMVDDPCRFNYPGESCIVIGRMTHHVVNYGIGRRLEKQEALDLIDLLRKKGAVHQVYHEREDLSNPEIAICNCCWDCCGVLGSYNRGRLPLALKAHFIAEIVNLENCNGCQLCARFCPTRAMVVLDQKVQFKPELCIGCGQCNLKCPRDVIAMRPLERDVILPLIHKKDARV